jgi:hypothetical protein
MKNYKRIYTEQKRRAGTRGIEWQFSFETWLDWWGPDIELRGRKKGQLVMARTGDIGPYSPDNVRKATAEGNIIEGHLGKNQSEITKKKIGNANRGRIQTPAQLEKNRIAQLGKKQSKETIEKRMKSIRDVIKGPQPKVTCPHCGTIGGNNVMMRHHFNRCKTIYKL